MAGARIRRRGALGRLLLDPEQEFSGGLTELLQGLGVAQAERLAGSEGLDAADRQARSGSLLAELMRSDCGGAVGFWTLDDGFKLDPALNCARLPREGKVVALQGQALPASPWRRSGRGTCRAGAALSVGMQGGNVVELACPEGWAQERPQWRLRLRPDALAAMGQQVRAPL
ncbi:MAG: hypothetical protein U1E77_07920 [Inhella sp.]